MVFIKSCDAANTLFPLPKKESLRKDVENLSLEKS